MAFNKRVLASFTFAWTLAAAGMAAVALSAAPERRGLEDVQIGERGDQTRIVLVCATPCGLEKRSDWEFILRGVDAEFSFDLSRRSENVAALTAARHGGDSLLRVKTRRAVDYANTKNCVAAGRAAACIDLFFAAGDDADAKSPVPAPQEQAARNAGNATAALVQKPALREGAPERLSAFMRLPPPERLAPPRAMLAKVQPIEETVKIRKPSIRMQEPAPAPKRFDYGERVQAILGVGLSEAYCDDARATLQADAWALDAMVDVGLCAAAGGDAAEAEDILSRLLEYTPDNYAAHVGRALIAAQAGEKGVARKYFQDALNALPPIEESNRIVQAMRAL